MVLKPIEAKSQESEKTKNEASPSAAPKAAPSSPFPQQATQAQPEKQESHHDDTAQASQSDHAAADSPYNAPNATVDSIHEQVESTWA